MAHWAVAEERSVLITRGAANEQLLLVLQGDLEIDVGSGTVLRNSGGMMGELTFLEVC